MKIKIWGCRGSLPVAMTSRKIRDKIAGAIEAAQGRAFADRAAVDTFIATELPWHTANTFGGNTSCVQIDTGGPAHFICDLGSGLREFGSAMLAAYGPAKPQVYNVFMSHLHWDHIMGFPFFTPAYIKGNVIRIHTCHPDPEVAFLRQQSAPCFPVDFATLGAAIEFKVLEPGTPYDIDGVTVSALKQYHQGDSFGWRFTHDGKSVVYSTDSEHKQENADEAHTFADFFAGADAVVFDAQYSLAEAVSLKQDWGHSSNMVGVELCHMAGAKTLVLFHHEPAYDDAMLYRIWQETIRYEELARQGGTEPLAIVAAVDGLVLPV